MERKLDYKRERRNMLTVFLISSKSFLCLVTSVQQTEPDYYKSIMQISFSGLSWGNISEKGIF